MSAQYVRRTLPWFIGALGTALLVALLMLLWRGSAPWWLVDFSVYRFGAETIAGTGDLYLVTTPYTLLSFTYPPIAALMFLPFTLGSMTLAGFVWVAVDAVFLVGAIWLTLGAVGVRDRTHRAALTVPLALLAVLLVPVDYEFAFGQLNLMLMFLILLDLLKGDGRRWQGVAIGVAAGIKLIPLIYVVYLACTGRIRAAVTALGAFAATIVLAFVVLPAESVSYWFGPGLSVSRPGVPMGPLNQALRGVFARLLGTDEAVNPAWLVTAVVVGLAGVAAAIMLHRKGFALRGMLVCALTALLVSPVSWVPHWVWAVPLLIVRRPGVAAALGVVARGHGGDGGGVRSATDVLVPTGQGVHPGAVAGEPGHAPVAAVGRRDLRAAGDRARRDPDLAGAAAHVRTRRAGGVRAGR